MRNGMVGWLAKATGRGSRRPRAGLSLAAAVLVLALLAMTGSASATTRYASPVGDASDSTCANPNDPCDIVTAVEVAPANGDDVLLAPGDYDLGESGLSIDRGIAVSAQDPTSPPRITNSIAEGSSGPISFLIPTVAVGDPDATLEGVHLENTVAGGRALTVIAGGRASQVRAEAEVGCSLSGAGTITDSICHGRRISSPGVGVRASGDGDAKLVNVTAVGEGGPGIAVEARTWWYCPLLGECSERSRDAALRVDNSIAYSMASGPVPADVDVSVTTAIEEGTSAVPSADVNLFQSNFDEVHVAGPGDESVTAPGSGSNQLEPPAFVKAEAADFHQAAGSATIDAGNSDLPNLGAFDVDGEDRVLDGAVDIGADERDRTPTVQFEQPSPVDGSHTNASSLEYHFDSGRSDVSYTCALFLPDAIIAFPQSCTSPWAIGGFSEEGTYRFSVRASDADGDTDTALRTFVYDATDPDTVLTGTPGAGAGADPSFSFGSDEAGASFRCRLDAGAWSACLSPHRPGPLAAGSHIFEVEATDRAGNADPTPASHSFVVRVPTDPRGSTDPGEPGPAGPGPAGPDITAPTLTLGARRRQSSPRGIVLRAGCDEPCAVVARLQGKARISSSGAFAAASRKLKAKPARARIGAGETAKLRIRFKGRKTKRLVKRTLRQGRRIDLKLLVKATDDAGNRTVERVRVKLQMKKRKNRKAKRRNR